MQSETMIGGTSGGIPVTQMCESDPEITWSQVELQLFSQNRLVLNL